jgi:hypothetical protein
VTSVILAQNQELGGTYDDRWFEGVVTSVDDGITLEEDCVGEDITAKSNQTQV